MDITLLPGTYIVAVSGGVDSMVLLDLLARQAKRSQAKVSGSGSDGSDIQLVVAHFDHGIRADSGADQLFVRRAAKVYSLPFVFDRGYLGPNASEASARTARYRFLEAARRAAGARAIITAHHEDDRLETAFINTLRGTGRRGLSALKNHPTLLRPLLGTPKSELLAYAEDNNIGWREDSTNQDLRYLRNHVRHRLLPTLAATHRAQLLQQLNELQDVNYKIDRILVNHLHTQPVAGQLNRQWFIGLPFDLSCEIMITWLKAQAVTNLDKKRLAMVVVKAKTLNSGKQIVVDSHHILAVGKRGLALLMAER
jgi:tRNA(Ile)-lysidine synthetase-like protein